jgi:hypothetical protein
MVRGRTILNTFIKLGTIALAACAISYSIRIAPDSSRFRDRQSVLILANGRFSYPDGRDYVALYVHDTISQEGQIVVTEGPKEIARFSVTGALPLQAKCKARFTAKWLEKSAIVVGNLNAKNKMLFGRPGIHIDIVEQYSHKRVGTLRLFKKVYGEPSKLAFASHSSTRVN